MTDMQSPAKRLPRWADGPIVVAGNWEPLIFRRRLNSGGTDAALLYAREHTAALADRLKDLGVNLLITHWFKGFGLEAEAEDIAAAETLIRLCHERDIHVAGYIGDTLIHETMLLEEPDALSWVQRTDHGRPITMGGTSSFRYKWCRTNPAFMRYMKRVIDRAVASGLDMLHFDNFLDKPEPLTCRCACCAEAFRGFLKGKYPEAELTERLGFSGVAHVIPPSFSKPLYIAWDSDIIQDPLHQEWIDFRCQTLGQSYGELADYARSLKPDIVIECNPTGILGENSAYMRGVDHRRLLPRGHFFWDESPNPYGLFATGALSTNVRSMKMGQTLDNRVFFYCYGPGEHIAELKMAEALAYNGGCLGMVGFPHGDEMPDSDVCRTFSRSLHAHPDLFCRTTSMAHVAVFRQFQSLAYDSYGPHLQALLAEETLLRRHVPFDFVFDLDRLDGRLLIVPGMDCLSDLEVRAIKSYVSDGGRVILIGRPGRLDSWRRPRPVWPFEEVFTDGDRAAWGRGHVARMSPFEPAVGSPAKEDRAVWDTCYKVLDSRCWLPPRNANDLVDLLTWQAFGHVSPITTNAPTTTLVEPRRLTDGRTAVHIINYDAAVTGDPVNVRISGESLCAEVVRLLPEGDSHVLEGASEPDGVEVCFENDGVYSVLVVSPVQ
jgi:hypothetical protein